MSYLRQIKVGIGSYSRHSTVALVHGNSSFTGDVNISGITTAASFYGNGATLSGVVTETQYLAIAIALS